MRQIFKVSRATLLFFLVISCYLTVLYAREDNFRIDYYSGGGFTGFQSGLTIFSDGTVKFWKQNLSTNRQITDSLRLSGELLRKFNQSINNPEFFTYHNKLAGNYTTYITLARGIQLNRISFNGFDFPADMPASIKELISEIKIIYNK
jgi:hypothetical protein